MKTSHVQGARVARPGLLTLFSALSVALVLIGCGGGSSDGPSASPAPAPPAPPASDLPQRAATRVWIDDGRTIGSTYWPDGNTSDGGFGQPVNGMECTPTAPITYHVHTHLSIFLNGEALAVPRHVGIVELSPTEECLYHLHTHDASGLLHQHASAPTTFTLGQFFAIWGQPLVADNVGGIVGIPAVVYITDEDGIVTEYEGDLTEIELVSHREITIEIGTPIDEIPNYMWSGP